MTFDQLKYFITVAEMGSFSNASVALYISQSTISKQIAALEHELGVELFSRKTKQIELTEAGRFFRQSIVPILDMMETAHAAVKSANDGEKTSPRLIYGVDNCFLDAHIVRNRVTSEIFALRKQIPNLIARNANADFNTSIKRLTEGELDLFFCGVPERTDLRSDVLSSAVLGYDEFVFVLRRDLVEGMTDEEKIRLLGTMNIYILRGDTDGFFNGMHIFRALNITPEISFLQAPPQATMIAETGAGVILCARNAFNNLAGFVRSPLTCICPDVSGTRIRLTMIWNHRISNAVVAKLISTLT